MLAGSGAYLLNCVPMHPEVAGFYRVHHINNVFLTFLILNVVRSNVKALLPADIMLF